MKKLKTITICLVIAYIVIQYISGARYFKHVFDQELYGNYAGIFNMLLVLMKLILNIAIIVTGILALVSAGENVRDRAYAFFRYMYVIDYMVAFPLSVFSMILGAKYLFSDSTTALIIIGQHLITITFIVLLLICKPQKPVQRVNLQNYDMVAFTTAGHRFVHYLLDDLFLLPVLMSMGNLVYAASRMIFNSDVISFLIVFLTLLNFFLYYFLSEAIFRQTFGKMITRTCVVGNGPELSTGRVFLRTLCRLIPFDNFSFLFGANWHDQLSNTAVVYVDSWEKAFEGSNESAG